RFRRPLVLVSQDVFPEIAVALGRLKSPFAITLLRAAIKHALKHADRVVAIGAVMRDRLVAKGAHPNRIAVIPNWADTERITPQQHDNAWSREHGLAGQFVVMHSGNVGHAQNLETLLRATAFLDDLDQLRIVIIGSGARHAATVELAHRLADERVAFLPYQPYERLPEALSAAHVHFVGLPRGLAGYIVPSRVHGILAAGRPILAAVDEESETATLVREAHCGVVVPPDDPAGVADAIRALASGRHDLAELGRSARAYAERVTSREQAVARYRQLLADVTG
ncbi:MAG TPA: glycosyltransferase family 4 protein, partial [Gaiellaceae bacterium]|nr:glycosyltransferase family 4 protein [Gaiellaceae bacterium]